MPGVYGGFVDKLPLGSLMNRSITMKTGQTHVHRYLQPLLERIQKGELDPSFVITHELPLEEAPSGYKMFRDKQNDCVKVVLKPEGKLPSVTVRSDGDPPGGVNGKGHSVSSRTVKRK